MRAKLWVLMVTAFVDMLGLVIVLPLLPFYATKLGANATLVGTLIAAFPVAQLASPPVWGRFSDKYGRVPHCLQDCLFRRSPLGTTFVFPAVTAALSRVVPTGERGLYMGVQHTFGGISRVAFPLAAGATMNRFGLGIPFYVAGGLVAATLLLTVQMEAYTEPPVIAVKPSVAGGL